MSKPMTSTSLAWIAFLVLAMHGHPVAMMATEVPVLSENSLDDKPTYQSAAEPLFRKYCNSCHNSDDREGGLSLTQPGEIAKGGENGPALLPGNAKASRLIRMIQGELEPRMPPDDMPGPTRLELESLMAWIDDGAKIDSGASLTPEKLVVPDIASSVSIDPVTDLDWSPDGRRIAVARYQRIDILDGKTKKLLFRLDGHPGKVNSVSFSADSRFLLAATGVTGLKGLAIEWDLDQRREVRRYGGHADVIYDAVFSPDASKVATAGYDRKVMLWNRDKDSATPAIDRTLNGHNDAVYRLEFSPTGKVLASASGDQTVKLWSTSTGERLDTLGQPLNEQFVTLFHPQGDLVLGAGRDNRIRVWNFVSQERPEINPLSISRFAHEASIVALAYSRDGKLLVSSAEDRTIRIWSGRSIELLSSLPNQSDVASGLAVSPDHELAVGRLDGSLDFYSLRESGLQSVAQSRPLELAAEVMANSFLDQKPAEISEAEPNSTLEAVQEIQIPADVRGTLSSGNAQTGIPQDGDVDLYRIRVRKGETWILETNAARSKSPADTQIAVLDAAGQPVVRARLQAVRDSYFTFRGKDAFTSDDFRVHNWEEMELNELLYCNGEIVRLFLYPRGPDSGFQVYPGFGNRHAYFDSTPVAHALQEPCYIVKAYPPEAQLPPNGLPVFDVYYENDDDANRELGSDSKLYFTAPRDGDYLVRVSDSRGLSGDNFSYRLLIRSPKPDFSVDFNGKKMKLKRGSGREFALSARRIDNFNGPIDVLFENVPAGIQFPDRVTIQQDHYRAYGVAFASLDATQPTPEQIGNIRVTAVATVNGKEVRRDLGKIEQLELEDSPRIQARIVSSTASLDPEEIAKYFETDNGEPTVLTIQAGTTMAARLIVKRNQHEGDIDFGNADSGRNLPHGVFVDNIGLNGLRIIKGQGDVREIFVTAAKWVPEQTRLFHLKANNIDGETTLPILLKVVR